MTYMTDTSNSADIIDSRDVIARITELEEMRDETPEDFGGAEAEELAALTALAEEAEAHAPDWTYGEILIREDYFTEYAQTFAEDIGALPDGWNEGGWPMAHVTIDWEAAAEDLKMDYTEVDYDGVTYYVR